MMRQSPPKSPFTKRFAKASLRKTFQVLGKVRNRVEAFYPPSRAQQYAFQRGRTMNDLVNGATQFLESLALHRGKRFVGFRFSHSATEPTLYSGLAYLLFSHLVGRKSSRVEETLELVLRSQDPKDGLFKCSTIASPAAEIGASWGWSHLTLHALMTLGLYERKPLVKLTFLERWSSAAELERELESLDWGANVDETSNAIQNLGVALQFQRDYLGNAESETLLEVLRSVIARHRFENGLFSREIVDHAHLSKNIQAGYHFWLLDFYDRKPLASGEALVTQLLETQNEVGGFGVQWNSSACEDIDTLDPLVRLAEVFPNQREAIQHALQRHLPYLLFNLNADGGFGFRSKDSNLVAHKQMYSGVDESNAFYTWFRFLSLAYLTRGLVDLPERLRYEFTLGRAPGHQFW